MISCGSRRGGRVLVRVSGEVPSEPVVTKTSGQVFERRLIEKFVDENGVCPVTGEPLTREDLLLVKSSTSVKPRAPAATSIPSLLSLFQNEWDALMLETFTLKQKYQQAREELANALYEQDAACRVIARLKDERDSAREALATLKASAVPAAAAAAARSPKTKAAPAAMDVDESAAASKMPESIAAAVVDVSQALSQTRRKRKAPEGHTPKETVSTFKSVATVANLHTASAPGMLALDVSPHDADQVVTAGVDKSLKVVQRSDDGGQEVATLKGHTKKVNAVQWHAEREGLIVSGSADNTVKLWQPAGKDDKYKAVGTIKAHSDEVTAVSIHPSGDYLLSAGADGAWAFHSIEEAKTVFSVAGDQPLTTAAFHPDGLILATGTNATSGIVKIWDIRTQNVAFECPEQHAGGVSSLAFSENGFNFATATSGEDGVVKIWDLRKLSKTGEMTMDGGVVRSIKYDYSGMYLAVAGSDLRVFLAKQATQLLHVTGENTQDFTGVTFTDRLASTIATVSMDRTLKFFSA